MARRPLEEYRRAGAETSLEDDWISEAESDPADAEWFLATGEALAAAGEVELGRGLLGLWDDVLRERGLWPVRLEALRRAGSWLHKPNRLQREVVETLREIWRDKPNLASTLEWVGLQRAIDDSGKLWDKVTRVGSVLEFDVGQVVAMQGQGIGRVVEVNLSLENLRIDFDKKSGVTLGFRAAAKMLRPLPPEHPLRRKLEDPAGLDRLRDEDPAALLRAVLQSSDRPLTGGEIRDTLAGIVSAAQWTAWWNAARRHPQVVASGGGRPAYRWEASEAGALDAVRRSFDRATPRARVEVFRKNSERDPALARELAGDLASTAAEVAPSDPGLAWEIFFALERAGQLPASLAGLTASLLSREVDPHTLLAGIEDRLLRERALAMLRERRPDWPEIFAEHFAREEEPRVLSALFEALAKHDATASERLLDDLVAQPRRSPAAFVWLCERAADDEPLRARAPLRLLQQVLLATASEEFAAFRVRLRPLLESGGTLPRLLGHLGEEQSRPAFESIQRATALEGYQREPLANALRLRFPSLNEGVDAGPLYATVEAVAAKREELQRLTEVEIPANRKAIEEARSHGDLRENFEYKAARQRHEYLNARVASLHRDLGRVRPIDFARLDTAEVRIGARVTLLAPDGGERAFSILGPWDSKPEAGVISYESDLGKKLLGLRPNDSVAVGENEFRVREIQPAR